MLTRAFLLFFSSMSDVQLGFLFEQLFFCFNMFRIRNAAINRANGCALRLLMKSFALGTLIWYDVIDVI